MNEDNNQQKRTNSHSDFKGCLGVVVGIMAFGLLLAFFSKNFHGETMTVFGLIIGAGALYALIKHTETTIQIVVVLIVSSLIGSVFNRCSKHEHLYEGPSVGFR
jgi:uncharacterized membrane protein